MSKSRDKGRLPPFVPLLLSTIDCPAWRNTSHGAKWLYVALKRKSNSGPRAYVSYRDAIKELKCGRGKVREWFAELQHYGFIELHRHGSLGIDGKGKAPHWRLTEKGQTSKASPEGLFEPPPNTFLKWDGALFDPKPYRRVTKWAADKLKKQNPSTHVRNTSVRTSGTPPVCTSGTPQEQSGTHVGAIEDHKGGTHVGAISRLTTTGESPALSPALPKTLPERSKRGKNKNGIFDERIAAMKATERRLKAEAAKKEERP